MAQLPGGKGKGLRAPVHQKVIAKRSDGSEIAVMFVRGPLQLGLTIGEGVQNEGKDCAIPRG